LAKGVEVGIEGSTEQTRSDGVAKRTPFFCRVLKISIIRAEREVLPAA
jgi:hypothetical protein